MKAPVNFAERVKGHKLKVGSLGYSLGDNGGDNNKVWIYPEGDTHNVILMEFNWEKQYYVVNIVKTGDGNNFHTTLPAFDFVRTSQFLSFASFISWMIAKIDDLHKYFEYK